MVYFFFRNTIGYYRSPSYSRISLSLDSTKSSCQLLIYIYYKSFQSFNERFSPLSLDLATRLSPCLVKQLKSFCCLFSDLAPSHTHMCIHINTYTHIYMCIHSYTYKNIYIVILLQLNLFANFFFNFPICKFA